MFVPKDFSEAIFPIKVGSWIAGIGVIEYPLGHPRELLSFLYTTFSFICSAIISINFINLLTNLIGDQENMKLYLQTFIYGNLICYLNGIINEKIYRNKLKHCFQEINNIDERFGRLGIQTKYTRQYIGNLCLIAVLVTIVTFDEILTFFTLPEKHSQFLMISHMVVNYSLIGIPLIIEFHFLALISYLRGKFQQLNNLLEELTGCDTVFTQYEKVFYYRSGLTNSTNFRLGQKTNDNVERLRAAKEIHLDLVKICRMVNDVFGLQLLLSLGVSVSIMIITSVDIFYLLFLPAIIKDNSTIGYLSSFIFCLYSMKVMVINHVPHMTSGEAFRTRKIVCQLNDPTTKPAFRAEVNEFTLQLKHNQLTFTAHGFFDLNHGSIQTVIGVMTTYLVILVQIRDT